MIDKNATMIAVLGICGVLVTADAPVVSDPPTRWELQGDGSLRCELDGSDPFPGTPVEYVTHGRRVIMRVLLPVDDGSAEYLKGPEVQWPIFKKGVRDKPLKIPGATTRATDLRNMPQDHQR